MAWFGIENAPKDGTPFRGRQTFADRYTGKLKYTKRRTWWGKTSHVPLYGWCHGVDPEDTDLWSPTHWQPLTRALTAAAPGTPERRDPSPSMKEGTQP